jgi:NAD(P)-dependent dehydrogenase (short-subunit alcohol dehydrogenase family)
MIARDKAIVITGAANGIGRALCGHSPVHKARAL